MNAWFRCSFDPVDVVTNADPRPLDSGGYGHDAAFSPIAFAGALRTAILVHAGYDFRASVQTAKARLAGDAVGIVADRPFSFACAAPLYQSPDGTVLFATPRDQLVQGLGEGYSVGALAIPADGASGKPCVADEPLGACRVLAASSREDRPDERCVRPEHLAWLLGRRVQEEPAVEDAWRAFSAVVTGQSTPVKMADLRQHERRHGHGRGPKGTVENGLLFSRSAVRFKQHQYIADHLECAALTAFVSGIEPSSLPDGAIVRLGGDGHIVRLQVVPPETSAAKEHSMLAALERLCLDVIPVRRRFLVYLATPAVFNSGWHPSCAALGLNEAVPGVRLVAAAVGSPFAIGGWDLRRREPRPVRRAVPAGAVYFYEIEEKRDAVAVAAHVVERVHFATSISDEYAQLGMGLSLVGAW